MKTIVFENRGEIDARSITTFGISSKENQNAIGFFGTGLKYAIAVLLRLGHEITIQSGENVYEFGVETTTVRVDSFDVITMNGTPLGFTTELGKTWQLWQAFREIACNTLDEDGRMSARVKLPKPVAGKTRVLVKGTAFYDVFMDSGDILLKGKPLVVSNNVEIHPGPTKFVFYRGVRVGELEKPSQFKYNLLRHIDLTEDRTYKYSWDIKRAIAGAFTAAEDSQLIESALLADDEHYERGLDFEGHYPCDPFQSVVLAQARTNNGRLNKTALTCCRPFIMERLNDQATTKLNEIETKQLNKAVDFLTDLGFSVGDYPIIATDYLGEGVLGMAKDNKIYISRRTFLMGTKMVAGTVFEEYLHLSQNVYDETRDMQNFLIDTIVSLGERLTGEPL